MHNCLVLLQTQHAIRQSHVSFGVRHLANSHYYLGNRCQNASMRALSSAFFFLWGAPSQSLTSSKSLADFNAAWINTTSLPSVAFYLITHLKQYFYAQILRTFSGSFTLIFTFTAHPQKKKLRIKAAWHDDTVINKEWVRVGLATTVVFQTLCWLHYKLEEAHIHSAHFYTHQFVLI